jgi:hypothetical protein
VGDEVHVGWPAGNGIVFPGIELATGNGPSERRP